MLNFFANCNDFFPRKLRSRYFRFIAEIITSRRNGESLKALSFYFGLCHGNIQKSESKSSANLGKWSLIFGEWFRLTENLSKILSEQESFNGGKQTAPNLKHSVWRPIQTLKFKFWRQPLCSEVRPPRSNLRPDLKYLDNFVQNKFLQALSATWWHTLLLWHSRTSWWKTQSNIFS